MKPCFTRATKASHSLGDILHEYVIWVKKTYCLLRRRCEGVESFNPSDQTYGQYWEKAALICAQNRIDPREFIEVQFFCEEPWPEIAGIASDGALVLYRLEGAHYASTCYIGFDGQKQIYERKIEIGGDPRMFLSAFTSAPISDHDTPIKLYDFKPLFIYCKAKALGLQELAAEFEARAFRQYLTSVHHDKIYGDAIPPHFKTMASDPRNW